MKARFRRLRGGEVLAGAGAVLTLVFMLALEWYPPAGGSPAINGWSALNHARWLILLTVAAALLLVYVQLARAAPAVPVSMSVVVTLLGVASLVWLIYRILINSRPHGQAGAYLGLISVLAIALGGYWSLRQEAGWRIEGPEQVPTVRVGEQGGS